MPDVTLDQIDTAIRQTVAAASPGEIVTGWTLVFESTSPDLEAKDARYTQYVSAPGQSAITTLGLLTWAADHRLRRDDE